MNGGDVQSRVAADDAWQWFRRCLSTGALAIAVALLSAVPLAAQTPENVAVVINENSSSSQLIGEHYVKVRGIPPANVLRIRTTTDEVIERDAFSRTIEQPLAMALTRQGLQDRILYLVVTKGVPLRVEGTLGAEGTVASVDSELTLLYRRMTGVGVPIQGRVPNPYFLGTADPAEARRFTRREHDIYLVSRLDAFTPAEAMELVDRARAPVADGRIVLHQRASLQASTLGDSWLAAASKRLQAQGHGGRVLLDTAANSPGDSPVLGYYSWGSIDPLLLRRRSGVRFVPGAIAVTYVGTSARTLTAPPPDWVPSHSADRSAWFADMPHGLVGDLVRDGATGAAGYVWEPYLEGAVRPDILFPAYMAGFNLVESFYLATPFLSWQTVIIGDPLCEPFPGPRAERADIDGGNDAVTGVPAFFSDRRAAFLARSLDADAEAMRYIVRSEARFLENDLDGGRRALEEASRRAPTVLALHRQIASLADRAGDYDEAAARYRRILELEPNDAMALNNLAYTLAVHRKQPAAGKPFAERALALSKDSAAILDTMGVIEHLLGNHEAAVRLLTDAVRAAPARAEMRLHLAAALVATGDRAGAANHLTEALRIDPSLATRADTADLRRRIEQSLP